MLENNWYALKRFVRHVFHIKRTLHADPNGLHIMEMFGGTYV